MITEIFFDDTVNVGCLLEKDRYCMDIFIKKEESGYREMKNFLELTKNKTKLLDVGCAVGMFSLVFCNKNEKQSHALDASHETQLIIEQTLALNPNKNIKYHKMFLGDRDSITTYNSDGFHAFATNGSDRVIMLKMDTFCSLMEFEPDVIKIDTEGYEYNVLIGGEEVINEYRPIMFIELHPKFCNMYGTKIDQVFDISTKMNYIIKDINNSKVTIEQLYQLNDDSIRTIWTPL